MVAFAERRPILSAIIVLAVAILVWAIFAPWPDWLEDLIGRKKIFLNALFNGITLGALYFLVASGFTLIFGLMKNVNLAHGSLYLFGGYIGYEVADATGWWLLSFVVAFIVVGAVGVLLQVGVFRRMEGEDLKQTLVTISISIVLADLMLWIWGGDFYTIETPDWLSGPIDLPLITGISRRTGEYIYLKYPIVRLVILLAAIAIGGTVTLGALMGGPLTGASMNPARSLGPALVAGVLHGQWIYVLAPVVGALLGAFTLPGSWTSSLIVNRMGLSLHTALIECLILVGGGWIMLQGLLGKT